MTKIKQPILMNILLILSVLQSTQAMENTTEDSQEERMKRSNLFLARLKEKNPEIPDIKLNPIMKIPDKANHNGHQALKIPKEIEILNFLRKLDISDNGITILPEEIGKLINLEKLILSKNKLTSLPSSIGNLTKLKNLNLHKNELSTLPEEIWNLTKLERLKLSDNKLTEISSNISKLSHLKIIQVPGNKLIEIPKEICGLTQLQCLNLGKNNLEYLPTNIKELKDISVLKLHGNLFSKKEQYLFNIDIHCVLSHWEDGYDLLNNFLNWGENLWSRSGKNMVNFMMVEKLLDVKLFPELQQLIYRMLFKLHVLAESDEFIFCNEGTIKLKFDGLKLSS